MTDLSTWLLDNSGTIFRFEVYKKVWTPYEIDKKFMDQTEFTDTHYQFGIIKESIELPDKDVLLGIQLIAEDDEEVPLQIHLTFYKLSEIRLSYHESDKDIFSE